MKGGNELRGAGMGGADVVGCCAQRLAGAPHEDGQALILSGEPMQFDYRHFHIDCRARHAEDGLYYACAKITRVPRRNQARLSHESGDIDSFANEADALCCARSWAIEWCDVVAVQ
jgi:hypothetical protein